MTKFLKLSAAFVFSAMVLEVHATPKAEDHCPVAYEIAETVMMGRQQGLPMPRAMEIANGVTLMEEMVIEAYGHPAYSTKGAQDRAIRDFADKHYRYCLEVFRAAQ